MSDIRLSKFDATGNDFLVLVDPESHYRVTPDDARVLCDRERGIGADGLIHVAVAADGSADLVMTLLNADGSHAEMSGNGMRCLAAAARRAGAAPRSPLTVSTDAGVRTVEWSDGPDPAYERVDMGPVTFDPSGIPIAVDSPFGLKAEVDGTVYEGDAAGIGNPHFVVFVDDPLRVPVEEHGRRLEHDTRFPHRVNVEFVHVEARDRIRMRVWERGVGETRSCGTGACAASAVARRRGLVDATVAVEVPGGVLTVELGDTVWLGGPVSHVGDYEATVGRVGGSA